MKTINIILLAVLGILILFTACTKLSPKPQTTELSEIVDITDTLIAKPKPEEAISIFNLNNNLWNGADFHLQYITNVSFNTTYEAHLEPENEWLSNKFQRAEKVKKFYAEINKTIANTNTEAVGKDNSAVYFLIAKELNRLSQSKATNRILLIYSDLMENTDILSFYNKWTFDQLKTKPEAIEQYFDSQMKLPNLSGIKIYLIYQPKNTKQDEDYKLTSSFYKRLLEEKGATVEITANLN